MLKPKRAGSPKSCASNENECFWFICRTAQSSWTPKVDSHYYSMKNNLFFSFDRICLIIHQFERLPLHVFKIVPTLHVLKLKKYIHLLWMANTYVYVLYVHTYLCMPDNILSDLSNWFGIDYRPEKSRMNCGTNVAYTAQKNIQMKSSLARVCFSNTKWRNGSAIAAISPIVLILFELNASFVHCLRLNLTQFSVLTLLSF